MFSELYIMQRRGNEINNNCKTCISGFEFLTHEHKTNCYQKCNFYYYFDESNQYHCTGSRICPQKYNKLIQEKNKCIDKCQNDNTYVLEYNNICYENCPSGK